MDINYYFRNKGAKCMELSFFDFPAKKKAIQQADPQLIEWLLQVLPQGVEPWTP